MMTVAQTRAARRKNIHRYKKGKSYRSLGESIAAERRKAANAARIKK